MLSTVANLGIPTKLLHESLGHIVSVELKTGAVYRGKLFDGELTAYPFGRMSSVYAVDNPGDQCKCTQHLRPRSHCLSQPRSRRDALLESSLIMHPSRQLRILCQFR